MIVKKKRQFELHSKDSGRLLGKHKTKKAAEKQELAIRLSKLRKEGRIK